MHPHVWFNTNSHDQNASYATTRPTASLLVGTSQVRATIRRWCEPAVACVTDNVAVGSPIHHTHRIAHSRWAIRWARW